MLLRRPRLSLLIACFAVATAPAQRTIGVPADQPSIQRAIDSSSNGDTVLVGPGTYLENINFKGRNIVVTSSGGAASTILDGSGTDSTVKFISGEARTATLSGFTVRNGGPGTANAGGGIFIKSSSPSVLNNVIVDNACNGIASLQSSPLIRGNSIRSTRAFPAPCSNSGIPILLNLENPVGGVTEFQDNLVADNVAADFAAIFAGNLGEVIISRNIIRDNNSFTNTSGTAISLQFNRFATVAGNLVQNNYTYAPSGNGGGIFGSILRGFPQTFYGLPQLAVLNNTVRNNGPSNSKAPQVLLYEPSVRFQVANNVLMGPSPAMVCYVTAARPQPGIENNISAGYSPACLADAAGTNKDVADPVLSTAAVPLPGSPALDAGNNSVLPQFSPDAAGSPRVQSATSPITIDAGAFEAAGAVTSPQARIVIAPLRYEVLPGASTDVSVALTSSDVNSSQPTSATLYMDGVAVKTVALNANDSANFESISIPSGQHTLYAISAASGTLPPARSVVVAVNSSMNGGATALPASHVVMQVDPVARLGDQLSTQFRCFLSDGTANSGAMRQYDNGILKVQTILLGAAVANATYISDPGPHIYQCEYQDPTHTTSTVATQVLAPAGNPAMPGLQLFSLPDPSEYGDAVRIGGSVTPYTASLGGHVRITEGTTVVIDQDVDSTGLASIVRSDLSPGIHTFNGTVVTASNSTNATFTQTVHFAPTFVTLAASPTAAPITTPITLTTSLTSTYKGQPVSGTLQLIDGNTVIDSSIVPNSTVTLPPGTLGGGTHTLTVHYPGSSIFAPATSNAITVTITVPPPPDFALTPANPSLSVKTEYHADVALTLTAINGFNGPVSFRCDNLPRAATCTFSAAQYPLSSTAGVTFTVDTSVIPRFKSQLMPLDPGGLLRYAFALPLLLPFKRRRAARMLLLCGTILLTGCSGKYPDHTPPGTYTVSVVATGTSGGTVVTHSVPFTLTVTP